MSISNFKKFSGGDTPGPPLKGGGEGGGREGKMTVGRDGEGGKGWGIVQL